jgi:hypothetical protein
MPDDAGTAQKAVYFSSKQAEEIGFDKFANRQARLHGIFVLVLDRMQIRHDPRSQTDLAQQESEIVASCGHVTELDLSGNLFESVNEVFRLCALFPKLTRLVLGSNRFTSLEQSLDYSHFGGVRILGLSDTLLTWPEAAGFAQKFPGVSDLTISSNEMASLGSQTFPPNVKSLDVSTNDLTSIVCLAGLSKFPNLQTIILKHNPISLVDTIDENAISFPTIVEVDLAHSTISSWSFFDRLPTVFPGMRHLRVAGAPLFLSLSSVDDKPLTAADGYMLTIARLPQLKTLNFSPITDKERLNAEIYYQSQIALELDLVSTSNISSAEDVAAARAAILARHPRWSALCEEYGVPAAKTQSEDTTSAGGAHGYLKNPNSLGARLIHLSFVMDADSVPHTTSLAPPLADSRPEEQSWTQELPRVYDMYSLLGNVGSHLSRSIYKGERINPLSIRLFWLSGEFQSKPQSDLSADGKRTSQNVRDDSEPHDSLGSSVVEWWDSSEEDDSVTLAETAVNTLPGEEIEVELLPGTRSIGSYIEGRKARIRVVVVPPAAFVGAHAKQIQ